MKGVEPREIVDNFVDIGGGAEKMKYALVVALAAADEYGDKQN
jgi:hypothetical protein